MLRTAAIRTERGPDDGLRVSVMSRHTFDGDPIRRDPSIRPDLFDLHLTELAPVPREVGKWYRSEKTDTDWESFELAYLQKLRGLPDAWLSMARIANLAVNRNATLLCTEPEPHYCHRRLLAEEIVRQYPGVRLLLG